MKVYVDGSTRGNPGLGGIGCVVYSEDGKFIEAMQKYIGDKVTNNYAEYVAVIEAIKRLNIVNDSKEKCTVYSDSRIVVKQVCDGWKINYSHLRKLNNEVKSLLNSSDFDVCIVEIHRDDNRVANDLAQDITAKAKNDLVRGRKVNILAKYKKKGT